MALSPHLAGKLLPMSDATSRLLQEDKRLLATDRLQVQVTYHETKDKRDKRMFSFKAIGTDDVPVSTRARYEWWRNVPGAMSRVDHDFEAPVTDTTVLCTIAAWGWNRIEFLDEETQLEFQVKFVEFFSNQKIATHVAKWKETREVPDHAPVGREDYPPMSQQRVGALCLLECQTSYNLHWEMRTGKTYATIMAMDTDCLTNPGVLNLVICPKNVRTNWRTEVLGHTTRNVNVVTLRGSKLRRMKNLLDAFETRKDYDYTVVIVSYEGVSRTLTQLSAFKWRWGIADEAHYFKQQRTERWKALRVLRESCEKRVGLTGTPICNSAMDLYTQFEWLGDSRSGFHSYEAFCDFYGVLKKIKRRRGGYDKILIGMQNVPLLQERLALSGYAVSKREALPELPPMTHSVLEVEMTPYQKDVYREVATHLIAEIENDLDSGKITITNILTRLLRLAQITAGFVAMDGEVDLDTGEVLTHILDRFDPNPKLDVLMDYIKERPEGSKTIVWSCFVDSIKQIRARLELEGIKCVTYYGKTKEADRDAAVQAFNSDPEVTVFIGNPAAGGVGINLNGACFDANGTRITQCDSVVYYAQGWSSPVRLQSQARPQDKTCTWPIEVVDLCVLNTIDFEIRDRVFGKAMHAMQIQDVKHLLKRLAE